MSTAIEVGALTMSYAERHVLKGVDFEVKSGEVFCLLGPNGAGKTTTVEILEGFRQRTGGNVTVLGMDPQAQPVKLRERIGIVLQECGFPRQARVAELIDSWRAYYRKPRALADLLSVVELTEDRKMQVRRLSGGQRRRLDLALALAGDPDLIFLDEPTTGFDPESRRRCWAAIENLRTLGKTIVLTTHYLDEAERLADRVAILQGGRIQVAGTVRHVARQAGVKTTIKFSAPERVRDGSVAPPSCLGVVVSGEVAVCQTENSATALRELLGWAAVHNLGDLDDLSVEAPTLEDAYLQLVAGPVAKTATLPGPPQAHISRGGRPPGTPRESYRRHELSRTVSLAFRQALLEQRSFWRSAEYALFTFALPIALLLLIGSTTATGDLPGTSVEGQMIFVPSIIAFGVIVAAYVNLGAKLATLRHDGVLKRIRTTPLPAGAYLSGVLASTAATTLAITASIMAIGAFAFHAVPRVGGLPELAGGLALGVLCFGALGLALSAVAGSAESAAPIANASYLPLAIMSGIFDPTFPVPHWLSAAVGVFPVRALAQILQQSYTPVAHAPVTDLLVLLAWTAAACAFAAWRFKWH